IRCDQIVQVFLWVAPFPTRDHYIALDAFRTLRFRVRELALGNAVRPVPEIFERQAAKGPDRIRHVLGRLSRLHATDPCFSSELELAEGGRNGARGQLTELMAANAVAVLDRR